MKPNLFLSAILSVGLLLSVSARTHAADKEAAALKSQAKITKKEARRIALGKVPKGKVKEQELEKENGKLIWSFDIATKGSKDMTEVHVDALTGDIISVEKETPSDEKKEKRAEKKEAEQKK
jgi:uncharacterized membrane protein YkoI